MNSTLKSFAHGLGVLGDFAPEPKPLIHKKLPNELSAYHHLSDDVYAAWSDVIMSISNSYNTLTKDEDHRKKLDFWKLYVQVSGECSVDLNTLPFEDLEKLINQEPLITKSNKSKLLDSIKVSCESKRAG